VQKWASLKYQRQKLVKDFIFWIFYVDYIYMKIHRFLIGQKDMIKDKISDCLLEIVNQEVIHQLTHVLKIKNGQKVVFLDGQGMATQAIFLEGNKSGLKFNIDKTLTNLPKNKIELNLLPALIKKDKIEYVLQKCTEIGVVNFQPIISDRSEKLSFKMDRAEKIIKEAFEQSEKNYLPQVSVPLMLEEYMAQYETLGQNKKNLFYLDIEAPIINVNQLVSQIKNEENNKNKISFFVGPEGGWSDLDRKIFHDNNVKPISLGDTVLRAETASIAVASLILLGQN